jgi:branched-chain amino acid transport system substrate-binding protein
MRGTVIAGLGAVLLSGAAQAQQISGDVVRIGVLTDMSGAYADLGGQGSVVAAQLAIEDFSVSGTVAGKRIDLISADHQNKPDIASTIAREWYDTRDVDVIVDLPNSAAAYAVMDLAEQKKRVVLVSSGGALAITNERCNAYTAHWVYDSYPLTNSLPAELVRQGKKRWFILTVDYSAGHVLEAETAKAVKGAGGEVVGTLRHPLGATDFSSFLLQAQRSGADVIALANTGQDAIKAVNTADEFGITRKQMLVPLLMVLNDVHAVGLDKMQGVNLLEPFYWDRNEATRAWARRFNQRFKRMPNMAHAGVYSAVLNYLKAIEAAGSDNADAVMKALKSATVDDAVFKGKVREDGRMVHDMLVVEVKAPAASKEPWDYYTIKSVIAAEAGAQPLSESKCKLVKR